MSTSPIPKLTSLIFILFLASNVIVLACAAESRSKSKSSKSLIRKACSNYLLGSQTKSCYKVLASHPNIASCTNFLNVSIAIIQSGISNATTTRDYIDKLLRGPMVGPNSKDALQECRDSFDLVISSFNSAFSEVKKGIYDTATYDLSIGSTDNIKPCLHNLASRRIKDASISYGVNVVPIFGLSASQAIDSF